MVDPAERIVNLALFLASVRSPVTVERIRLEVAGYPDGQEDASFLRMFERDKDELRAAGLVVAASPDGTYHLDASRSFCAEFALSAAEETLVRAAGAALVDDPSFPFPDDLRRALLKIASATDSDVPSAAHLADERPREQGRAVATLTDAAARRKRVKFGYTNADGRSRTHLVEPYGLFLREGRWYLVGRDTDIEEVRVYTVARMADPDPNPERPKTPDFEPPHDFDVATFVGLPFHYGTEPPFEAVLRFPAPIAWSAEHLSGATGTIEPDGDGLLWNVTARNRRALLRWVLSHGPGIELVAPADLAAEMLTGLEGVASAHG